MALLLLVAGLGLLCLPGVSRPIGRRLPPPEWAALCGLALVGGAATLEFSAILYAAPTVLRAVGVPALAMTCERLIGPLVPGGASAGWTAAAVAVMMPALGLAGGTKARRGCRSIWVEPGLGEHRRYDRHDLVVLPTAELVAVSVSGVSSQIIVSQGMVDALAPEEFQSVLRHEMAHLDHAHQRWLVLIAAVERSLAVFPPLRRSTAALRAALERWADEAAVQEDAGRRAVLRGALLRVTRALVSPAAAFSAADSVIERLDALGVAPRHAPRVSRALVYIPGVVLGVVILIVVGASVADARMVVAMAGRCPA